MKPLARETKKSSWPKYSTDDHAGRNNKGPHPDNIKDKTFYCKARPGAKEKIRNANRAAKKRGRQRLKRQLLEDYENEIRLNET